MSDWAYDDFYEEDDVERAIRTYPRIIQMKFVHPISQPDKIEKYVKQTKVWIDGNGAEHKIKDMEKEYLFNILSWAEDKKDKLNFTYTILNGEERDIRLSPLFIKIRDRYFKLAKA